MTTAMRLVYYDIVTEYLRTGRQVIPCYAALAERSHELRRRDLAVRHPRRYRGQMGTGGATTPTSMDIWKPRTAARISGASIRSGRSAPARWPTRLTPTFCSTRRACFRVVWIALTGLGLKDLPAFDREFDHRGGLSAGELSAVKHQIDP
ncbi:MAG: hypothetical protein MZU95_02825 [Desulfomicrobium escambiense]|nr:hypothetical protein [Desulfomicrobium escambiense]